MTLERINEVVKEIWGKEYKALEKGNNLYELRHTIGLDMVGSARGVFEVKDNIFTVRYAWASQADNFASKVCHKGYVPKVTYDEPVEGDTNWTWSVVRFTVATIPLERF